MPDETLTEVRLLRSDMQDGFRHLNTRLEKLEEADGARTKHEEYERGYKAAKESVVFPQLLSWKNLAAIGTVLGLIAGFITVLNGLQP